MSTSGGSTPGTTAPARANIVNGYATGTVNGTTLLVTVPAGRTWVGYVGCAVTISNPAATVAAAFASAEIAVANGTGVATPAAGTYTRCDATAGANAAAGTVGTQGAASVGGQRLVVANDGLGTALINVILSFNGGATPRGEGWAIGELQ